MTREPCDGYPRRTNDPRVFELYGTKYESEIVWQDPLFEDGTLNCLYVNARFEEVVLKGQSSFVVRTGKTPDQPCGGGDC